MITGGKRVPRQSREIKPDLINHLDDKIRQDNGEKKSNNFR